MLYMLSVVSELKYGRIGRACAKTDTRKQGNQKHTSKQLHTFKVENVHAHHTHLSAALDRSKSLTHVACSIVASVTAGLEWCDLVRLEACRESYG